MKHIHKSLDLENRPETYKTILKDDYGSNTETSKIRRKMSMAEKIGQICSKPIPLLNNGRDKIFYMIQKEYFIVITKSDCYYCDNIESDENVTKLINAYKLNRIDWIKMNTININTSEVVICF